MRITIEIDDLEPGVTESQAVADYVRALFKVRALTRAHTMALREAETRAERLTTRELQEANGLIYNVGAIRRDSGGGRHN